MRAEIIGWARDVDGVVVKGTVTLDEDGHAVLSESLGWMEDMLIVEPGNPERRLTLLDGERYIRALPANFAHGWYTAARVVE
jgi:hypothetical protein